MRCQQSMFAGNWNEKWIGIMIWNKKSKGGKKLKDLNWLGSNKAFLVNVWPKLKIVPNSQESIRFSILDFSTGFQISFGSSPKMIYLGPIYPRKVGLVVIPNFLPPKIKGAENELRLLPQMMSPWRKTTPIHGYFLPLTTLPPEVNPDAIWCSGQADFSNNKL